MCHELTKDNLAKYAVANTLMITIGDLTTMDYFGFNWIKNAQDAGVTYWMLAALDEHTSEYVTSKGVKQCFTSPFALSNHIPGYSSKGEQVCHCNVPSKPTQIVSNPASCIHFARQAGQAPDQS
jgi:hypothetical protein